MCRLYDIGTYSFSFKKSKLVWHKINHIVQEVTPNEDGCWRKEIQALDRLNHSLDLGSLHPDRLKFTDGHYKSGGSAGELFYHTPRAKTLILFIFLHLVKFSPGSVGRWTQRSNECWLRVRGTQKSPFTFDFKTLQPFGPGSVHICFPRSTCTGYYMGLLILKHMEARWSWLDGVHDRHCRFDLRHMGRTRKRMLKFLAQSSSNWAFTFDPILSIRN